MKKRNPFVVFILSIITFGIYDIYWLVKTKKVLNKETSIHTPTIWLLFLPAILGVIALIVFIVVAAGDHTSTVTTTNSLYGSNNLNLNTTSSGSAGAVLIIFGLYAIATIAFLFITFFWFFKFSKAINQYTHGQMGTGVTFLLLWLLHFIGVAIVQDTFNDMLSGEGGHTHSHTPMAAASGPPTATPTRPVVQ